jgi:hypothetical protein
MTSSTSAPASLNLSTDQKDILTKLEVDFSKLKWVNNHEVDTSLPVDGYSSGHYLIFVEGKQEEHVAFFKKMYNTQTTPELAIKIPGLWVYETPSAKFNKPQNKVSIMA